MGMWISILSEKDDGMRVSARCGECKHVFEVDHLSGKGLEFQADLKCKVMKCPKCGRVDRRMKRDKSPKIGALYLRIQEKLDLVPERRQS